MKIDVYAHLFPPKLKDMLFKKGGDLARKNAEAIPTVYDLEARFRIMDKFPDVLQVLSVPGSPEDLAEPGGAVDLAKRINDEMAEVIFKYPDRFAAGVAVLPISDIDASLKEIDRAINELKLRGILLRIPINGKPVDREEFMPIYEKMCQHNLPIWWHPHTSRQKADYPDETESKYFIWHLWGMISETTVSMTRLVMSGMMERFPKLKIITHHCGAMVPFFAEKLINAYNNEEMRRKENHNVGLTEAPIEYFRRFYNDTAILGNTAALMCAHGFFGAEHILFGTDAPMDVQLGAYGT